MSEGKKELSKKERKRVEELLGDAYLRTGQIKEAIETFGHGELKRELSNLAKILLAKANSEKEEKKKESLLELACHAFETVGVPILFFTPEEVISFGNILAKHGSFSKALSLYRAAEAPDEKFFELVFDDIKPINWCNYQEVVTDALSTIGLINCRARLLKTVDSLLELGFKEAARCVCKIIAYLEFQEKERKAAKPPALEDMG